MIRGLRGLPGAGRFAGFVRRLAANFDVHFQHTRMKLQGMALLGSIGFPAFYLVWAHLIPQPYENLPLRLVGFALCFVLFLHEGVRPVLGRALAAYSYVGLIYCVPFFFTFMMLKNGVNAVWLGTEICGLLFLSLLVDPLNLLVIFGSGAGLAVLAFLATGGTLPLPELAAALPVMAFGVVGGIGLNFSEILFTQQARLRALAAVGSSIAHEMRTPLLSIRLDAEGARELLAEMMARGGPAAASVGPLARPLDRIADQVRFANTMIDMLLVNVSERAPAGGERHSLRAVLEQALDAYPFRPGERAKVVLDTAEDFDFLGSDVLVRHVAFNLLKNALRAVSEARRGGIVMDLRRGRRFNSLVVTDTGTGIPRDAMAHVFEPFFTTGTAGTGAGLGMAFCRRAMEGMGGSIGVESDHRSWTRFTLRFPAS